VAASKPRNRNALARAYAKLAHAFEERGEHGRAAECFRLALLVLYNYPEGVVQPATGVRVAENDDGAEMSRHRA